MPDTQKTELRTIQLARELYLLADGVNTGLLLSEGRGLLFNCGDGVTPALMKAAGAAGVDKILCTQYRRSTAAGLYAFLPDGAQVLAPAEELELFAEAGAYWSDPKNHWHVYEFMPDTDVLPASVPAQPVRDGDTLHWQGYDIRVLATTGATHGGVSYLVSAGGRRYGFCGDLIYDKGQILSLTCLARGNAIARHGYHGFMAAYRELLASLRRLCDCCDCLIPARGAVIRDPAAAVALLERRLRRIYANYVSVSALHYYFPGMLTEPDRKIAKMRPAGKFTPPEFVRNIEKSTSRLLLSADGAAFLIDCGQDHVPDTLEEWRARGELTAVEGCWITHYHDDHVNAVDALVRRIGCPIYAIDSQADVLAHPGRYHLPCLSPVEVPVRSLADGTVWQWHEFTLTAFRLPGQSLYHGGLLAEGRGARVLFAGDSFAPTGLDDYCAQNRNFVAPGTGYDKCLALLRAHRPDCIINEHQPLGVCFTDTQLDFMERKLTARRRLYEALFPWPAPDCGLDDRWVRAYPYAQTARPGHTVEVALQFTNHAAAPLTARVRPALPEGWTRADGGGEEYALPPATCGVAGEGFENPDAAFSLRFTVPADAAPGAYALPFGVALEGRNLGQIAHAVVCVEK